MNAIRLAHWRNEWNRRKWKRARRENAARPRVRVRGFDLGLNGPHRGEALLIYLPGALEACIHGHAPRIFNPDGANVEIALALNEAGYRVDAVQIDDADFPIEKKYEILVAHAGNAYSSIGERLHPGCRVLDYSTGCHWREFNRQTSERIEAFCRRRGISESAVSVRPLVVENEDYAVKRADLVVCLGAATARTFAPYARRVAWVNNAAYLQRPVCPRPMSEKRRRHFLYTGGTGNIQKGLDLLIEAFAQEPGLHLHIDSPVEPELLAAYPKELRGRNIHYVEWQRKLPNGPARIAQRCAFTLNAAFNSGQSTAFIGSLAFGLIPISTVETSLGLGAEIPIGTPSVDAIRDAICQAAGLSLSELGDRSRASAEAFQSEFSTAQFRRRFRQALELEMVSSHPASDASK